MKPGTLVRLHSEATRIDSGLRRAIGVVTDQPTGSKGWLHWFYEGGRDAGSHGCQLDPRDVVPLVIIDPEDREQVERLMETYRAQPGWYAGSQSQTVDCMQAALREFADPKPPKPEEPTGLGAVVEDAAGTPWVRCENADLEPHWYARNKKRNYADIAVVRVLSEGVRDA